jgi:hypothetical protein
MTEQAAAVETGAEQATPQANDQSVDVHPSIADMLSHDPGADALGGLTGAEQETTQETTEHTPPEETGDRKEVEPPTTEKVPDEWQKKFDAMLAKADDERRKRQDLEARLYGTQEPPKKADLFEDPDTRLNQELGPIQQNFENRLLALSESNARRAYGTDKFNEAQAAFLDAAKTNLALVQAALNSADPGEYQYQEGQKLLMAKQLGDGGIDELKARMKADLEKEQEAEINKRVEAKLAEIKKLPPSSAEFKGKTPQNEPVDTDLPLSEIIGST